MIIYLSENGRVTRQNWAPGNDIPDSTIWIDLFGLTPLQEKIVEDFLGIDIPSQEEMHEIEVSNRLYHEKGALYMTATLVTKADTPEPENHSFTFIVTDKRLITIRYIDPVPFRTFASQLLRTSPAEQTPPAIFMGLIDAIINRLADVLEHIGRELDTTTKLVFSQKGRGHQQTFLHLGHSGDLASKTRESLVTIGRMVAYAAQSDRVGNEINAARLKAQSRDILALSDHAAFLSNRVNFLLDATIGMLSIEQNHIIKIFSVAAVMFLPPTLVASVYGMNFDFMPELKWHIGYPFAILLMVASAVLPFWYFRRRKWL